MHGIIRGASARIWLKMDIGEVKGHNTGYIARGQAKCWWIGNLHPIRVGDIHI